MVSIIGGQELPSVLLPPNDVVKELTTKPWSLTREYLVEPHLTIDHIRALVDKRTAEVAFSENNGRLWINEMVNTGSFARAQEAEHYNGLTERFRHGRLVGHTHPRLLKEGHLSQSGSPWLSWQDIWNTMEEFNPRARYFLFHPKGGLEYTRPEKLKDISKKSGELGRANRELLTDFSKRTGVNVHIYPDTDTEGGPIGVRTLSREEKLKLAIRFVEEHKMILQSATWEEKFKIQELIDELNSMGKL